MNQVRAIGWPENYPPQKSAAAAVKRGKKKTGTAAGLLNGIFLVA